MTVCWPADAVDGPRVPPAPVLGRGRSAVWNYNMELAVVAGDAASTSTPVLMKACCRFFRCPLLGVYHCAKSPSMTLA